MNNFFRSLSRRPLAYILNIIGLSTAFIAFYIIMAQVVSDFSFDRQDPDSDRIFRVEITLGGRFAGIHPYPLAEEIISSSPQIQAGAILTCLGLEVYFTWENSAHQIQGYREKFISCTESFPEVFEFNMLYGSSDALKDPDKILIPKSLADKIFGKSVNPIGKTINLKESLWLCRFSELTVGGVYHDFPENCHLYNWIYTSISDNGFTQNWAASNFYIFLKLQSKDDALIVKNNYETNFSSKREKTKNSKFIFTPIPDLHFAKQIYLMDGLAKKGELSSTIILLSIGILILLLATINFTNFAMALVPFKIKSVNTRKVFGCSDRKLKASLIGDAITTTALSFILALGIITLIPSNFLNDIVSAPLKIEDNPALIGGILLLSILIGLFAGIYPAKYATSFSPALVLKGSFGLSQKGLLLRKALVAIQFIISLCLITVALFIEKQNALMQDIELGFDKESVVVVSLNTKHENSLYEEKLSQITGVQGVAFSRNIICSSDNYSRNGIKINGESRLFNNIDISWNFPEVLGLKIYEGRDFANAEKSQGGYILNRRAQELYELSMDDTYSNSGMIGFFEDVRMTSLRRNEEPTILRVIGEDSPYFRGLQYAYIRFDSGINPKDMVDKIITNMKEIDPLYPINILFFDDIIEAKYIGETRIEKGIKAFSVIAIIISMLGIFGLLFFDSQQKRKEIAIRRLNGATEGEILKLFSVSYLKVLGVCFIISIPIIIVVMNIWLKSFSEKINLSPFVFLTSIAIVLTITMLTIIFQIYRALRMNPVRSLQVE